MRPVTPPRRAEILAWAFYDFANSAFTTLVVTFVFAAYFARRVAPDPTTGGVLWAHAVNLSAFLVAIGMPILGAAADARRHKKRHLAVATAIAVAGTAGLFWVGPGGVLPALAIFVVANVAFEVSCAYTNSFLTELSTPATIGRVSGLGWGLGYVGGLLCLVAALGLIDRLPSAGDLAVRSTNLLVAGWYLVFALPFFILVRERHGGEGGSGRALALARERLVKTFHELRRFRQAGRLLVARLVYNDGLVTIFAMSAVYAAARFDMKEKELIVLGIAVNLVAGLGALGFGVLEDRIGSRRTIAISLVLLLVATAIGTWAPDRRAFWVAALLVGLMAGPNQSSSRSLFGRFAPAAREGEFFGFFAFSGKLSSIAGPLVYGLVLEHFRSQRLAMGSIAIFFVVGLVLLFRVDEAEGTRAAAAE